MLRDSLGNGSMKSGNFFKDLSFPIASQKIREYFPKSSLGMRDLGKYIGVLSE